MKKLIIFIMVVILTACLPSTPQVAVTPEAAVTLTSPPSDTPAPIATATLTPTPEPQGLSLEALAAMSDEAKLAAAPTIDEARERIPAGVAWTIESQEIVGERAIVYYDAGDRQRAAYDLLTGQMYDGMSIYQYDKAMDPITAFLLNDSESLKEIPEKYFLKGQEHLLGEAIFAVLAINWAYPALVNKEMLEHNSKYGLSGVEAQWDFYNEKIKPAFIAALKDGSALKKGIMVEGKAIKDVLPTFVLVRGRDDKQQMYVGDNLHPWLSGEYDKENNIFNILMSPPKGVYSEWILNMLGGEFTILKGMVVDGLGGIGGWGYAGDFAKIITMILLGGKKVPAGKLNNAEYGTSNSEDRMPNVYPNLPKEYYEQGIDE